MSTVYRSIPGSAIFLVLVLLFSALSSGCLPREKMVRRTVDEPARPPRNSARLNVFLTLDEKQGPSLQLEIADLEVLIDDLWLPLASGPMTLDSVAIGNGQLFLGGTHLMPGQYRGFRLTITEGRVRKADGQQAASLTEPKMVEILLDKGFSLESGDSKTLQVSWDVENSFKDNNTLDPRFFVSTALRNLPVNLVFAACPDINTVFIVRADKNWVVDSFGVTGRPTYLAMNQSTRQLRFYVLTSEEKTVKVIDSSSYRVIDSYPTLNDEATYMTVSPNGQWAYLVHKKSGYVSRMNLQTGQIGPRVKIGSRPNFATYLEQQRLLAVSVSLANTVVLLDPETLRVVRRISTASNPEGTLVSDNRLYVAESGDASVSANDLSGAGGQGRVMVGFGPRRLVDADNQVFVSNYNQGSLSVLLPGQLGVVQEIYGLGEPLEMVFNQFYRRLYVADQRDAAIAVIDTNSNQLLRPIALGANPLGLTAIQ